MIRSRPVQPRIATLAGMKTRTLIVLLVVVAVLVSGALVLRADEHGSFAGWLRSLHGGGGGH
jgi:hypothetical protein